MMFDDTNSTKKEKEEKYIHFLFSDKSRRDRREIKMILCKVNFRNEGKKGIRKEGRINK